MSKISINFVRDSQKIHLQLAMINAQLKTDPTASQIDQLSNQLNQTHLSLQSLKNQAKAVIQSTDAQCFSDLEKELVHAYGSIQNAQIAYVLSDIQQQAIRLQQIQDVGLPANSAKKALKNQIESLLKDYCPSIEERKILSGIKKIIDSSKTDESSEAVGALEEAEELFEIANLFYNGKRREARSSYHQLSSLCQERFHFHMRYLMGVAFEDRLETLQALLATANEIVGNGESYPTASEVDEIFLGLRQVTGCRAADKHQQLG